MKGQHLTTLIAALGLTTSAGAISSDELLRQGFSRAAVENIRETRDYMTPLTQHEGDIVPPPFIPEPIEHQAINLPPPSRRFLQGGRKAQPWEGPTEPLEAVETAELEGTFREVENFFLRPHHQYLRFHALSEAGITGLIQTMTGEIAPCGTMVFGMGLRHTQFRRSYGQTLEDPESRLEQVELPFQLMAAPARDLELSLSLITLSEEAYDFGIIPDYSLAGISEVTFRTKYRWLDNPQYRLSSAVLFGVRGAVEPTVTRLGSNDVDFNFELAFTKRVDNVAIHAHGGFVFVNGEENSNDNVPGFGFVNLATDFQLSDDVILMLEATYQDFKDVGSNTEVTPGLLWRISNKWRFQLGVPVAVANDLAQGYQYRLTTAFNMVF